MLRPYFRFQFYTMKATHAMTCVMCFTVLLKHLVVAYEIQELSVFFFLALLRFNCAASLKVRGALRFFSEEAEKSAQGMNVNTQIPASTWFCVKTTFTLKIMFKPHLKIIICSTCGVPKIKSKV